MKYLVTGGAGFIGSNIVEELVKRGESVRVFDNFSTGRRENLAPFAGKIEMVEGDLRNDQDVQRAVEGIDYVIHQAALRSVPRSVDDPLSSNEVNVTGTLRLLWAARTAKVKRVVYASSSSVYGDSKLIPQSEEHATSPISPYATSKLAAENYCQVFAKTFGLETVSLRYFNVFGPRQNPESKYSAVIPKFIECALKKTPLEIHGDGNQSRDFTYIANVVSANLLAAVTPGIAGNVFNIACNETNSVLDIASNVERLVGYKLEIQHTAARAGDVRTTKADIAKATRMMGYKPLVNFSGGMEKTLAWFKQAYGY
jgi:nucleoside-diphosphate-sugar epimerase